MQQLTGVLVGLWVLLSSNVSGEVLEHFDCNSFCAALVLRPEWRVLSDEHTTDDAHGDSSTDAGEHGESHEGGHEISLDVFYDTLETHPGKFAMTFLFTVAFLIILAWVFMKVEHYLAQYHQLVIVWNKITEELSMFGLMSLILFMTAQFLSGELTLMIEFVHFLLFFLAMFHILSIVVALGSGFPAWRRMRRYELVDLEGAQAQQKEAYEKRRWFNPKSVLDWLDKEDQAAMVAVREKFVDALAWFLEKDFDFGSYLVYGQRKFIIYQTHVSWLSWVFFTLYVLFLFVEYMYIGDGIIFVGIGVIGYGLLFAEVLIALWTKRAIKRVLATEVSAAEIEMEEQAENAHGDDEDASVLPRPISTTSIGSDASADSTPSPRPRHGLGNDPNSSFNIRTPSVIKHKRLLQDGKLDPTTDFQGIYPNGKPTIIAEVLHQLFFFNTILILTNVIIYLHPTSYSDNFSTFGMFCLITLPVICTLLTRVPYYLSLGLLLRLHPMDMPLMKHVIKRGKGRQRQRATEIIDCKLCGSPLSHTKAGGGAGKRDPYNIIKRKASKVAQKIKPTKSGQHLQSSSLLEEEGESSAHVE